MTDDEVHKAFFWMDSKGLKLKQLWWRSILCDIRLMWTLAWISAGTETTCLVFCIFASQGSAQSRTYREHQLGFEHEGWAQLPSGLLLWQWVDQIATVMRKHTTWQFFNFYFSIQATNPDNETTEPSSLYISHQFFSSSFPPGSFAGRVAFVDAHAWARAAGLVCLTREKNFKMRTLNRLLLWVTWITVLTQSFAI